MRTIYIILAFAASALLSGCVWVEEPNGHRHCISIRDY